MKLQSNTHTSLRALASRLNKCIDLDTIDNITELKEAKRENLVEVVANSLRDDIEHLIHSLDKSHSKVILPKILIARGNTIKRVDIASLNYDWKEYIAVTTDKNNQEKEDIRYLKGKAYAYERDIQIIILTRNIEASINLQLELLDAINKHLRTLHYPLIIKHSDDTITRIDNYGYIETFFESQEFESIEDKTGLQATFITGKMKERFFKLSNEDIYLHAQATDNKDTRIDESAKDK